MKSVLALMCVLLVLLGAESALAGPGKGVKTFLVPKPVVQEKPLPEKTCRVYSTTETTVVYSPDVSVGAQFIQPGCCCASNGIYIPGVSVPSQSTPTTLTQTVVICD